MSRQAFVEAITYADEPSGNLKIANSAEVSVFNAGTLTLAKLYEERTGGALVSNPFILGATGQADFWADSGDYDIKIHDTKGPARFGDYVFGWQSSPVNPSIAAGDLSSSGDLEWTQELGGGWVPQIKLDAIGDNEIVDAGINEVLKKLAPAVGVKRGTNQSIPNKVWTSILFPEERFDTHSSHSNVSETHKLICKIPGIYYAGGTFDIESNVTGVRIARIVKGLKGAGESSEALAEILIPGQVKAEEGAAGNAMGLGSRPFILELEDWITMDVYQSSGGALNVMGDALHKSEFGMVWMRPLP